MKWILVSPLRYASNYKMLRDLGATALGLRRVGEDARFFMTGLTYDGGPDGISALTEMEAINPAWWKSQGVKCVIMMAGGNDREPQYSAVKKAGVKLILRMDTDGFFSPSQNFARYFSAKIIYNIDQLRLRHVRTADLLGFVKGAVIACTSWLLSSNMEFQLIRRLALADCLLFESPLSVQRATAFFDNLGRSDISRKCRLVPASICVEQIANDITKKRGQIASVGIWWRFQKDAKRLTEVISCFLKRNINYSWVIVGPITSRLRTWHSRLPIGIQKRVNLIGIADHIRVQEIFAESQIHFLPSRAEGFPNACSEAACMGCTNVGWADIAAYHFFDSKGWGTASVSRSVNSYCAALDHEIDKWKRGARDPEMIAFEARKLFSADSAALALVKTCKYIL